MVKIAEYEQRTQTPGGFITSHVDADTSIGQGLQRAGAIVGDYGQELQQRQNTTAAKQGDITLVNKSNELLYGPDGYYSKSGKNAVDALPDVQRKLDAAYQEQRNQLKGRALEMFDQQAAYRVAGWNGDLQRYALGQHKVEERATSIARENVSVQQMVKFAGVDDDRGDANLETAVNERANRLHEDGMDAAVVQDEVNSLRSKARGAAVEALILSDTRRANAYFDKYQDQVDPLYRAQLQTKLKGATWDHEDPGTIRNLMTSGIAPPAPDQLGTVAAADSSSAPSAPVDSAGPAPKAAAVSTALHPVADTIRKVWRGHGVDGEVGVALGLMESGLRDVPNGRSKGVFQMGPDAWAEMGGGDIHDLATQADHAARYFKKVQGGLASRGLTNLQPWQVYIGYQQGAGGGAALMKGDPNASAVDTLKAAGVGPALDSIRGNLPNRLRGQAATITNAQFLAYQRDTFQSKLGHGLTVAAGTSPAALTGGQPPMPDLATLRAQVHIMAGGDVDHENHLMRELETQYGNQVQDRAARWQQANQDVAPYLRDDNPARSIADIPSDIVNRLSPESQTAVANRLADKAKEGPYARVSDPATLYNLRGLMGTNPAEFAKANLLPLVGKLSSSDFDQIAQQQAAIRLGKPQAEQDRVSMERVRGLTTQMLHSVNINPEKPDGAAKAARFEQKLFQSAAAFQAQHGRNPNDQEMLGLADGLMLPTAKPGWFGEGVGPRLYELPTGEAARLKIPGKDRTKIAADFQARFKRQPTEAEIEGAYRQLHAMGAFK